MPVKVFLRVTSVITVLLGLLLIFFPVFIENFFVTHSSHGGDIFIRFLGSTLFGYACLNWFTSRYNDKLEIRSTVSANLATLTVAFFISLIAVLNDTLNARGWLIVLLHLSFATGFAVYSFEFRQRLK